MKKNTLSTILTIGAIAVVAILLIEASVYAAPNPNILDGIESTQDPATAGTGPADLKTLIANIIKILMFIIGAISVVMIILSGIKYTTSNGDQGAVKSAKDTLLYAVIGLAVAILSYAIVNFVVEALS